MKPETVARILVVALAVLPSAAIVTLRLVPAGGPGSTTLEVHASMPDAGGWQPQVLTVQAGQPVRFRLTSNDVVHGFAIGRTSGPGVDILPGRMTDTTITFSRPGSYVFYCTRWCGPDHWRMRGTIEVRDSSGDIPLEAAPPSPFFARLGIDLDAPHRATVTPNHPPWADRAESWVDSVPAQFRTLDFYRGHGPSEAWAALRGTAALGQLRDGEVWNLVARLWRDATDPARLAEGRRLYAANCAACHGVFGRGDGVMARALLRDSIVAPKHGPRSPADFTDPESMLGASPALLHGKIQRGGMGTGMPNWGPILTDEQAWMLVEYLWTFQFPSALPRGAGTRHGRHITTRPSTRISPAGTAAYRG